MLTATIPPASNDSASADSPSAAADAVPSRPAPVRRGPLHSLFWRIFLWFWLAMLLLAAAVAATVYITDPDQFFPRWRYVPLQRIDQLAVGSVGVFESKGPAELHDYLTHLPQNPASARLTNRTRFDHAYLFDGNTGKELSGQSLSTDTHELIDRAKGSADLQLERLYTEALMARAIRSPDGRRHYVFLLAMPRSSPWLPTTPQVWLQFAAALATSAVVCYWLTRNVVAPVRRLQAATRRLATGDLRARVSSTPAFARRGDEFSDLAHDFDEMAVRIDDLLTAQRRLIADISHELGSPLTRVNVALGLAFRKAGDEVRPELERIQHEAQRVNELIRQLLLLAELENRAPSEPPELIDLTALVREVAADAEFEAGSRHCRVRFEEDYTGMASSSVRVRGIPHLLRSAVENVVRNAVRYTAEDTEVTIDLDCQLPRNPAPLERVVIRVRDHGPGVPSSALPKLFHPFYRVSEARDRLSGGTGLGLAITRQAVEAHGGSVRAMNQSGGGLAVEIELAVGGKRCT